MVGRRSTLALVLGLAVLFVAVAGGVYVGGRALTSGPAADSTPTALVLEPDTPDSPAEPAPSTSASPRPSPSAGGGGGIALNQNQSGLLQSAVSQRNLAGLIVRVNQIDVCTAPDLVAYLTVTDEAGGVFADARPEDFKISIDGQPITDFQLSVVRTENLPLATSLVIDHSGSMAGAPMDETRRAASGYVDRGAPDDTTAVVQFDTVVETLVPPTVDRGAVQAAIAGITPRDDTALYDAVAAGVDVAPECGRRATVLMSDGRDTASVTHTLESAISRANERSSPVFVVGLRSEQFTPDILRSIAEGTGAEYFEAPTPADLDTLYQRVDDQLAGQYVLRFRLPAERTGAERRLRIETNAHNSPTVGERSFRY